MPKSIASEIVQPVLPISGVVDHHPDVTMAKSISSEVFKPNMPATSNFSSYVTAFSATLNNGHFQSTLSGSPQLTSVDIGLHPPQQITLFTSKWFMTQDIHLADALNIPELLKMDMIPSRVL
ncbi:hypothetical protein QJS10_CPB13g00525 [Acorus calamus]|uniref:Uncharacterized protein n=1 Tax=Acorus calamus TaxID=4465 RepID=A0AAV9DGM4_ACOCL|nr:hypothetical protein QJS10_CPB13g00525 [Acorus calamus]